MSGARRPPGARGELSERTILVIGAGDATAQRLALLLAARGAAIVAAGPTLAPAMTTAGLVAATGAVARVVEAAAPPLLGDALLAAAEEAHARPTDAFVAESAFDSPDAARAAADELRRALPPHRVVVVEARPSDGSKVAAERLASTVGAA